MALLGQLGVIEWRQKYADPETEHLKHRAWARKIWKESFKVQGWIGFDDTRAGRGHAGGVGDVEGGAGREERRYLGVIG